MYKVKIDIDALNDLQQAIDWYNSRQQGLGKKFQERVYKKIVSLKKTAGIFEKKYDSVRWVRVEKFPYTVHYRVKEEQKTVQVIGVFYSGRNPQVWENKAEK